jgi:lipopolysaccharide/colanic/teichoic acid biosynthesis glycosyltransferase
LRPYRHRPDDARGATRRPRQAAGARTKRVFDVAFAIALLTVLAPLLLGLMIAVKLDSRGPVFYRCRRAGLRGREFAMLKLRKMYDGARGPLLTAANDQRFTRVGRFLVRTKLDEVPQLWNVLKGEMSIVGPRPEDPNFVQRRPQEFEPVLAVRPGITGLSQLAFAREADILDPADREVDYETRILPQKLQIDRLYAERQSLAKDVEIMYWTVATVLFRRAVAVHRSNGKLTLRSPRATEAAPVPGGATSGAT